MLTERPQGLFGRLTNLIRGIFGIWLRDTERQNPRAVYEQAINERMRQYRDLKEAVAGILYMRTKLESEITERRAENARLHDETRRAVRRGEDDISLTLIAHKQVLMDDLERADRELEGVRSEAEEAKTNLIQFREEIRSLNREKGRMLATLANAQARRRIQEALEGLSVDAEMKALEGVREHIARIPGVGTVVYLQPQGGPSRDVVPHHESARGLAVAIRNTARELVQTHKPARIHLFLAMPSAAAMLLGHLWDRIGETQLYTDLAPGYTPAYLIPN